MTEQLKPGDLALVIGYRKLDCNLGKTVQLVKYVKAGKPSIQCGTAKKDCWVVRGNDVGYIHGGELILGQIGMVFAHHLMPLNGEFAPNEALQYVNGRSKP